MPSFDHSPPGNEQDPKYKIAFLNSIFSLAVVMALGIGFYRMPDNPMLGLLDLGFSAGGLLLLAYLKRYRERVEQVASLALIMCFLVFLAVYILAPYQTNRLLLFFLLAAAAFFLKGIRIGIYWLVFIILVLVATHFMPGITTGYSGFDIATTCVYLIALFAIFYNYEKLRSDQYRREREYEIQHLIDERWRLALEGAGDAVWDWDIETGGFKFSRSYATMLGHAEDDPALTTRPLLHLLHAEDEAPAAASLKSYLDGECGGQYVSERRMRCADGSYKWILCRGRVAARDATGRPRRMVGTNVDITERREAHEEVLLSRQALDDGRGLLQSMLDNAPLGIWMVDANGRVQFVNRGLCAVTGVAEAQFLAAAHYTDVLPGAVVAGCVTADRECLGQNGPHVSTMALPFVDGRHHLLEITRVRLLHRDGSVRGLIGLAADVTERVEHQKQLERLAHFDALTGVPNRVLLADRMTQALARTKREQGLMAVCYLDLDGFKPVNDAHGHGAGDKVLIEVTRRIREAVREDDTVARLGGDEFVVLLVGLKAAEECAGSLHRLLESIKQPITVSGKVLCISASIGVALYPDDEQDADTLLRHADQAMYVAKQAGRNRFHLFDPVSDRRTRTHHQLLQQIRQGLAAGEFELHYQPKLELRTRRLVGVEALVRWHHPQRGLLLPADFLRTVENTELELELGDWVIATAFAQMRQWRQAGHDFEVSVNVSAYHLQSANFVHKLRQLMQACCPQRCVRCIQIEVLETAALDDIALIGALIRDCKEIGVGFALDDFGTGYSSLTYLSKLDVDTLKIDQSFVRDMQVDKGDHAVVQGIIALARAFDMSIVAEGVENEELYQALLQMGCEVGQGHGIARPMPAAEFMAWHARQA